MDWSCRGGEVRGFKAVGEIYNAVWPEKFVGGEWSLLSASDWPRAGRAKSPLQVADSPLPKSHVTSRGRPVPGGPEWIAVGLFSLVAFVLLLDVRVVGRY